MTEKIILAGFGGQGIILAGLLIANAAMLEEKHVTHYASYGAEMRGGTCNCFVIVSDKEIPSPIITKATSLLIFNQPSKTKFESMACSNAQILLNSSLISETPKRNDVKYYSIDATTVADTLGNIKVANMVMLGAFCKITKLISLDSLIESLPEVISKRNQKLIEINIKALKYGYELV